MRTPENVDSPGDWVDVAEAAPMLGFETETILKLIRDGSLPAMQIAGAARTARRLPRALVNEARQKVFSGGQVELREFARQWAARNAVPEAAA